MKISFILLPLVFSFACSSSGKFECPENSHMVIKDQVTKITQECILEDSEPEVNHGKKAIFINDDQPLLEEDYVLGKLHGVRTEHYINGKKKLQAEYRNGSRHGRFTQWYENGIVQSEGKFRFGKRYGKWTWWDEQGKRKARLQYKEGLTEGKAFYWDKNRKRTIRYFEFGKCVKNCKNLEDEL